MKRLREAANGNDIDTGTYGGEGEELNEGGEGEELKEGNFINLY